MLGIRGLRGYVTRPLERGIALGVEAAAYEVSFSIPQGVSGGPLTVSRGRNIHFADGLVGVCLANIETSSILWSEDVETKDGKRTVHQGKRIIEYGVAASLLESDEEPIPMVGKSLYQLMGRGPGGAVAVEQGLV